jgi:hypothetical protein
MLHTLLFGLMVIATIVSIPFAARCFYLCRKVEQSWNEPRPENKEQRAAYYTALHKLERSRTRSALIVLAAWAVMAFSNIPGGPSHLKLAVFLVATVPYLVVYFRCMVHNDRQFERTLRS